MTNQPPANNQAQITITFYCGSGDSSPERLDKKYILKNWKDEADLRRLLDEIADELNYLSGYGIWAIKVESDQLKFTIDYKTQFKPYKDRCDFWYVLRFLVGDYLPFGAPVRIEIPRIHFWATYNNLGYKPDDRLFPLEGSSVGGRKSIKRAGTICRLFFDNKNPIFLSFVRKISQNGVLFPETAKPWHHSEHIVSSLSWWELPQSQTSLYRWNKIAQREEIQKKKEERERTKAEKAGIVYKDKKQTKKADQIYIIQMLNEGFSDIYKIGMSNAPGRRLKSLNTANPLKLEIIHQFVAHPAKVAEAKLHAKFEDNRVSGEWFKLTPAQIAEITHIIEYKDGEFIKSE